MKGRVGDYTPITPEMKSRISALQAKTGWGPRKLISYAQTQKLDPVFDTITYGLLHGWINGRAKSLNLNTYNAVIAAYEHVPEALYVTDKRRTKMNRGEIAVCPILRNALAAYLAKDHQLSLKKQLQVFGAPKKLTENRIRGIASGKYQSILPEHEQFIRKLLAHYKW